MIHSGHVDHEQPYKSKSNWSWHVQSGIFWCQKRSPLLCITCPWRYRRWFTCWQLGFAPMTQKHYKKQLRTSRPLRLPCPTGFWSCTMLASQMWRSCSLRKCSPPAKLKSQQSRICTGWCMLAKVTRTTSHSCNRLSLEGHGWTLSRQNPRNFKTLSRPWSIFLAPLLAQRYWCHAWKLLVQGGWWSG